MPALWLLLVRDSPENGHLEQASRPSLSSARPIVKNYLEHGETWYRALNGYAVTPGHRNSLGMSFPDLRSRGAYPALRFACRPRVRSPWAKATTGSFRTNLGCVAKCVTALRHYMPATPCTTIRVIRAR